MNTRILQLTRALAGLGIGLGLAVAAHADALFVARVAGSGPLLDPESPLWAKAPMLNVEMLEQHVATPQQEHPAVMAMQVRAVHNGQWLAFLIEWQDLTQSDRLVTNQFGDQVAVQLPIRADKDNVPNPMMGQEGGRVNILQWRAAFQHDIEHGEPTVKTLYPNALVDVYPDEVLRATDARPYSGALGMDNPVSRPKASPVLDQMAEGWGTLTVKPEQTADGRGVWKQGMWHVVITLPMSKTNPDSPQLVAGESTVAAFAAWEGGSGEVGSRKSWSSWVPLQLEN